MNHLVMVLQFEGMGIVTYATSWTKEVSRLYSRMALDLIHPPIQWEPWIISPSLKR